MCSNLSKKLAATDNSGGILVVLTGVANNPNTVEEIVSLPYKYGFITEIETEKIPKGLNEDVIRLISAKKNEPDFLLQFRLRAYAQWLKMKEPDWSGLTYSKVNYQLICLFNNKRNSFIFLLFNMPKKTIGLIFFSFKNSFNL